MAEKEVINKSDADDSDVDTSKGGVSGLNSDHSAYDADISGDSSNNDENTVKINKNECGCRLNHSEANDDDDGRRNYYQSHEDSDDSSEIDENECTRRLEEYLKKLANLKQKPNSIKELLYRQKLAAILKKQEQFFK